VNRWRGVWRRAHERNLPQAAARFDEQARDARRRAAVIKQALAQTPLVTDIDASGVTPSSSATG